MLQGILLVVSLLVAFTPVASTAFVATRSTHSASTASKGTSQAFSPLAARNACPPTQADGDSGTWVKVIQFRLNNLGAYPTLATDGGFGAKTKAAVISFQKQWGLQADGVVGPQTWGYLGFCSTPIFIVESNTGNPNCPPSQSEGATGIWVQAIQGMLNTMYSYGFFQNNINFHPYLAFDGVFGADTKAAVLDLQSTLDPPHDGVVNKQTWNYMGMCY